MTTATEPRGLAAATAEQPAPLWPSGVRRVIADAVLLAAPVGTGQSVTVNLPATCDAPLELMVGGAERRWRVSLSLVNDPLGSRPLRGMRRVSYWAAPEPKPSDDAPF